MMVFLESYLGSGCLSMAFYEFSLKVVLPSPIQGHHSKQIHSDCRGSQLLYFVFRTHAFQTAKLCVFCKKFLYESCLKNHINLFLKKIS
jgi:hypothetical protein